MKPTEKQIKYAMYLLANKGYSTRFMDASFKKLGATMNQRSGRVENWLDGMTGREISTLIDQLKS